MADILAEIKKRLTSEDEASRKLFQRDLYETIASTETPKETAIHAEGPQNLKELQARTGAHPLTLGALYSPDCRPVKSSADLIVRPSVEIHGLSRINPSNCDR
ncbi:hypothetical protein BELL_0624g00060 [Botrytis elliptica]|uniref:Uncharacterized protein n=1 Tax=Botrytis elliptica TaxID=278938 RepID=A0A4Z1JHT1_9HELO|nr:hypothetical protein BELL_0624g00060 [Botrytis elliptica]